MVEVLQCSEKTSPSFLSISTCQDPSTDTKHHSIRHSWKTNRGKRFWEIVVGLICDLNSKKIWQPCVYDELLTGGTWNLGGRQVEGYYNVQCCQSRWQKIFSVCKACIRQNLWLYYVSLNSMDYLKKLEKLSMMEKIEEFLNEIEVNFRKTYKKIKTKKKN